MRGSTHAPRRPPPRAVLWATMCCTSCGWGSCCSSCSRVCCCGGPGWRRRSAKNPRRGCVAISCVVGHGCCLPTTSRWPGPCCCCGMPLALLAFGVGWNVGIAGSGSIVAGKALPAMLPYFAVGMLAALLLEARELGGRLSLALGIAGVLLVLADATWQAVGAASHSGAYAYRIWRDLPAAAGFAALLALAATNTGPLASLLRWRPLVALGTISYGLYLWHVPVLLFARHNDLLPLHTLPAAALALVVAGALAAFSWRWVEQPALARAHAVTIRRRSWPTERPEPHPHHAG